MNNKKTMTVTIENFYGRNEFCETLKLPAKDYEIKDVLQRARVFGDGTDDMQISISDCPLLPDIEYKRLDVPTFEELNFLAERLSGLNEEDLIILNAVKNKVINGNEDELISIKDMINLTYGLEKVGVISNVGDYKAIGEFLIENELIDEITNLPVNLLRLLDKEKLGLEYMQQTGGVIVGTTFVYADEYKFNEIYDGKTLPQIPEIADFVFKLEITATPVTDVSEVEDSAEWIKLPIDNKEAHRIATGHGAERIEDCVYLGFESIIPQISAEDFGDMEKFIELNKLAGVIKIMTDYDQAKFKAILQSEEPQCIEKMLDIAQNLGSYEFAPKIDGAGNYYKEYISHFLDPHIDRAWVESLLTRNEGRDLMQRLGADETNYGFISTRGQSLFEYVSRYGNPIPLNEEFELIEVCGQTALFTNGRIRPEDVSHNLYRYDLRESEDGGFCSIEKNVLVNHGGTVLTKAPIDLNSDGVLTFNEETSPNFLGEDITLRKFLETDFTQQETDGIKIGDIK